MTTADHRITGPAELVQAVPYLLGFRPADSLVLVGLRDGLLVVTARLDLADAAADLLAHTVSALHAGGADEVIAAVYPGKAGAGDSREVAALVHRAADAGGCLLLDVLVVTGDRWRSLDCTGGCCPPEGRPVPDVPSAFTAAATVAGVAVLPDRRTLTRQLDPRPPAQRAALQPLVRQAEQDGGPGRDGRWGRSVKRALFAAARAADEPGAPAVDDRTAARFGAALRTIAIRDAAWMAVEDRRLDGRPLWRELGVRLPAPYDAAPLFLFGWVSWRAGNGALASVAAHRAVDSDPAYSAADLLLAALRHGVDPRRMPRLRLPRSA